jgi:hypothetical protein
VIYRSAGAVFPTGPVIGDPSEYTYRVAWSQVIPNTMKFWTPEMLPFVLTDRTIVCKHGHGTPNRWGTPCILSIVALQTPTLCCINVRAESYVHRFDLWWYARITPKEIRTIEWEEFTRKEADLLTDAVSQEPLRSLVGGRSAEHRRAPVVYRYPAQPGSP